MSEHWRDLFEETRAEWLARARAAAEQVANEGDGRVTINDVRRLCPPPEGVDPRVMGAVFRRSQWKRVAYIDNSRTACHHRPIAIFVRRTAGEETL